MTFDDIYDAVLETGLPVAVNFFEKDIPNPPYIVITYPQNNDMYADNSNYAEITQIDIALYAKRKNAALERSVENVLKEHFGSWFKSSEWVNSDHLQETIYTTEMTING